MYSTIRLAELLKDDYRPHGLHFSIVQFGVGGTGGYVVQRLSKLLYALSEKDRLFKYSYVICDGDRVEKKNFLRQPFIKEDLHQPKAITLAERYGNAHNLPISYKASYVEDVEEAKDLVFVDDLPYGGERIPILIGCVDNNATRQILHQVFYDLKNCVYIDSGIDSVDEEESRDSGYSGQVVCGFKLRGKTYLAPTGEIYPDILEDKDSRLPTHACAEQSVYHPQRMQTNEMAALITMGYLNTFLSDHELVSHYTNFNARYNSSRPSYIKELVR